MATAVEMPKLGNTVEECLLSAWRKHKGDRVVAGEVIADIETDKTTFELTAPTEGVVLETFFEAGALVPVFTTVCVVGTEGENVDQFRPQGSAQPIRDEGEPGHGETRSLDGDATTAASPIEASVITVPSAVPSASGSSDRQSPRARRFSRERDFHPASVAGTGPGGRVLEADLRGLFLSTMRPLEAQQVPAREQITAGIEPGIRTIPRPVEVPPGGRRLSTMRETIAKRLRESLSSTAQYTLHTSANAGQLLAMRRRLKAGGDTADITINDLVVFCTVQALLEVPELNAEFAEGTLYPHSDVHMAFACDTPRGLVVPVVRHSQDLSLRGLSRSMKDLAAKAVGGTIALDDLTGGTFTVSNLGSLGIEFFTPVINPLQVAILGVDAIQLKPVRKPDGNIEFIDAIGLSLTIDHQVIDGAPGARFLRTLTRKIETVETLCTT